VIGLEVLHPAWLLLLLLAPLAYVAWRRWPPPLERRRAIAVLVSRLLLVTLLALALSGVRLTTQPTKRALVAVVDVSASVKSGGSLDAEAAAVRSLQGAKGPDDLFGVVTFGHDAAVELPLTQNPEFESFQTQPDPSYTNVAGALRLAAGLIPDGYARQLVLVSDGRENLDDAASAVSALRAEGVRVDVLPVGRKPSAEALVSSVTLAPQIREGQVANVAVDLQSTTGAQGKLTLIVDGTELTSRDVNLPAGSSTQSFDVPGLAIGLHRIRAELTALPDTYAENNVGEAAVRVLGRPLVLVLEGKPGEGQNVESALEAAGMNVDRRLAVGAPTDTTTLGRYDSTVVVDAPADSFPQEAMAAIASSVHNLGKGLVTIGGPSSYGPGGWQGTPLEDASPVKMDIPNRKEKPKVAVVLVMETMEDPRADQVVLGAAESVIDQLSPDDEVAVTDGRSGFLINMTQARNKAAIDKQLESATLGDPPSYLPFLQIANDALAKTDAQVKHIVILGDGDATEQNTQPVQNLLQGAQAKGVTTSAIGVDVHGNSAWMSYMQDLARWGGGRFYESNNPSQVPQLFLKESVTSLRPWYEQTPFSPKVGAGGDLLQGVPTDAFPVLNGYVVTTPRPTAEQYLISTKQDPVLAAWSYGLGRSVAWTSDSTGLWTSGFLQSPVSGILLARMVAWTLPGEGSNVKVQAQPSGDGLDVAVSGPATPGATVSVGVVSPDLQSSSQNLIAVAPGRWQGRINGTTVGVYLLHGAVTKNGQPVGQADAAISVPYSPEYLQLGRDDGLLRLLARDGAGTVLDRASRAWSLPPLPIAVSTDVFWFLILLCALLWPLDVAARRITLRPRQLLANIGEYLQERRMSDLEVAAPAELARLRERVEGVRRRTAAPAAASGSEAPAADRPASASSQAPRPAPARSQPEPQPQPRASPEEEALSARLLEARRKKRSRGS
jgi:uncharacterized membrane protein